MVQKMHTSFTLLMLYYSFPVSRNYKIQMADNDPVIPVIDFDQLGLIRKDGTITTNVLKNVGEHLKDAFSKVGFCYLRNHGIDQCLIDKYFEISREFFELPVEEKMKYIRMAGQFFGWIALEKEKINPERPGDLKETFNYLPADDPDDWPTVEFQKASEEMFSRCFELSRRVCDALSVGLGLEESFLKDAHKDIGKKSNQTALRSLYYPPILPAFNIKPGQIRLGEHSDYGTITLLFQDDIGGLEVEVPGLGFVPATPIPGTVVVNIGDRMQRWTADALVATKHRVLIPEMEFKKRKHRQSVAFFVQPDDSYVIECLDGSNKYEPISSINYLNYRFSNAITY